MSTARVLLVEDNAVTRRLVQLALREDDIEIFEAIRGSEALPLAEVCRPDLVLLDIVLPDTTGFEVLEALRPVVGTQVPILAFTGLLASATGERLATSGFDDVIAKPIEPVKLREILRAYLPSSATTASFGARRRLLLVDDDPVQRKLVTFRLSRLGFEVVGAADGEEALAIAQRSRPDAVVSDVLMPRVDGFELCAQLRADETFSQTPIILLTNSYLEEADRTLAERVGADAYVVRTPELHELTAVLRETLSQPASVSHARLVPEPEAHRERTARTLRQLDRQMALHASVAQRSAMLAAELAILGGLTGALAEHRDVNAALDTALSACFDASGIAWGLLLVRDDDRWGCHGIGLPDPRWQDLDAPELARRLQLSTTVRTPYPLPVGTIFGSDSTDRALLAPIVHRDELLGAIVLGTGGALDDHHIAFAGVVAGQIALVLALARTFRELESATRAEQTRVRVLESTLNAIADPILVLDPASRPLHWNHAASSLARAKAQVPVADWPRSLGLCHADQSTRLRVDELPSTRALRGESVDDMEVFVRNEDRSERWLTMTARPVRDDAGGVEAAVLLVRDVTERKQTQARQIASDRMASIGVLAAGVAHEINNPLTAVLAEIEMAIDDTNPDQSTLDHLHVARDAARRVQLIVQDLKTLSRGDSDEVGPVDLHRVVDTAVRMAAPQTRLSAIVECDLSPVPPIAANESRLVQVLLNLLVNAAQAIGTDHPRSHRIVVRVHQTPGREVLVEVSDTGPGMTAEVRARLFTPFFTTKPVGMGTGLGLSICHRIVTSFGGVMDCQTALGQGATFQLRFPPLAGQHHPPPADAAPPVERRRLRLVVDDPLLMQVVLRGLQPHFDVQVARSAGEALGQASSGDEVDLVLCDASLTTSAGEPLHERLRHKGLPASRLALLGRPTTTTTPLAHLPRPFDVHTVQRFVQEQLEASAHGASR